MLSWRLVGPGTCSITPLDPVQTEAEEASTPKDAEAESPKPEDDASAAETKPEAEEKPEKPLDPKAESLAERRRIKMLVGAGWVLV